MTLVEDIPISIQRLFSRKKIKRDRSKLYKDNRRIIQEHDADIKNAEKHRKRYQHLEQSRIKSIYSIPKNKMSPMSLTEKNSKRMSSWKTYNKKAKNSQTAFHAYNITSKPMKKIYNIIKKSEKSLKRAIASLLVKYSIAH